MTNALNPTMEQDSSEWGFLNNSGTVCDSEPETASLIIKSCLLLLFPLSFQCVYCEQTVAVHTINKYVTWPQNKIMMFTFLEAPARYEQQIFPH